MKSNNIFSRAVCNSRGFTLIASYMVIAMVSVFSLAIFSRNNMFFQAAERNQNRIVAFNMAEAALDTAMVEIAADPTNYGGSSGFTDMSTSSVEGGYSIQVCPPECTGLTQPTDANTRLISISGYAPGDPSVAGTIAQESRAITAYGYIPPSSLFNFAVFADEDMQINGNPITDSYDSSSAAYDASTAGSNGDIGTNGTGSGDITLTGNVVVNGDAAVGPGGDASVAISTSGSASITGTSAASSTSYSLDTPTTPASATDLGTVRVNGNSTYTLPAGTYYMDSLSVSGNGTLQATGEVVIYVGGSVSIAGNGVSTSSNTPPNFLVMVTGTDSVSVSGNGDFYGGIYAPNSDVSVSGNGDVYGAIVSNTYHQSGNGDLHFDEAMNEVEGGSSSTVNLLSWVEEGTLLAS